MPVTRVVLRSEMCSLPFENICNVSHMSHCYLRMSPPSVVSHQVLDELGIDFRMEDAPLGSAKTIGTTKTEDTRLATRKLMLIN